jgi:hypothetical protein
MGVEHCDFLSWFFRKGESHEQDGERLSGRLRIGAASGDPAMAFVSSLGLGGLSAPFSVGSRIAA